MTSEQHPRREDEPRVTKRNDSEDLIAWGYRANRKLFGLPETATDEEFSKAIADYRDKHIGKITELSKAITTFLVEHKDELPAEFSARLEATEIPVFSKKGVHPSAKDKVGNWLRKVGAKINKVFPRK